MKKASFIDPKDLQQLEFDTEGNIIIPEGYEIYIKDDPETIRLERIAELEKQLNEITEPTNEELIEEGKMMSLWHITKDELNVLKGEL